MRPLRRTVATAAAAVLLAAAPGREAASGTDATSSPNAPRSCVAGVCLGAPETELLQRFGAGRAFPEQAPSERCYQARGKSYYVTALLDGEDSARPVTAVVLSSELTCPAAGPARFAPDRAGCRGLQPFDSHEKLRLLGADASAKRDLWPEASGDVTRFDYRCEPEKACGVMGSGFVRNGSVIAVAVWKPAC